MDPTDQPHLHLVAQVLNEHMKEIGLNADMQSMDWSTLVSRRAVKGAPSQDKGGWNIFPTAWPSSTMMDPIINLPLDAACDQKNWFGWPCDEEMQKLRLAYLAAKKIEDRKKAMDAIQTRFFETASYAFAVEPPAPRGHPPPPPDHPPHRGGLEPRRVPFEHHGAADGERLLLGEEQHRQPTRRD